MSGEGFVYGQSITTGGARPDFDAIAALLEPPDWHAEAACYGQTELMFSERPDAIEAALAICAGCPVRAECAEAGRSEPAGVWGGASDKDRRAARRRKVA